MFILKSQYLTPKERLSGRDLAVSESVKVSAVYDGGVVVQIEGLKGEAFKLIMSRAEASQLTEAIEQVTEKMASTPSASVISTTVPA